MFQQYEGLPPRQRGSNGRVSGDECQLAPGIVNGVKFFQMILSKKKNSAVSKFFHSSAKVSTVWSCFLERRIDRIFWLKQEKSGYTRVPKILLKAMTAFILYFSTWNENEVALRIFEMLGPRGS